MGQAFNYTKLLFSKDGEYQYYQKVYLNQYEYCICILQDEEKISDFVS